MAKIALKQIEGINELALLAQTLSGIDLGALEKPTQSIKLNFIGNLAPLVGTAKWSPAQSVTLRSAYFIVGGVDDIDMSVAVKKNNNVFVSLSASAGDFKSNVVNSVAGDLVILDSDFLTVDITQASSSSNLTLILEYQTWVA